MNIPDYPDAPIEGICSDCKQIGIQCYHICRAWESKLDGSWAYEGKYERGWYNDKRIETALKSKSHKSLLYVSTHGHFCQKCVDERFKQDQEHINEEYPIKTRFTLIATKIFEDIILFHQ
jgi:hypothetical protein